MCTTREVPKVECLRHKHYSSRDEFYIEIVRMISPVGLMTPDLVLKELAIRHQKFLQVSPRFNANEQQSIHLSSVF